MKNERIPIDRIEKIIFLLRGEKVLLGQQLAELYGVPVKVLIQAVKRNRSRFPEDFMFQLSRDEFEHLKSQFVTSSWGGLRRALPYAFTEQRVAMLSSVLRSRRAVQVNVAIMRAFVSLRRMLAANETLARRLADLERRLEGHDQAIKSLFNAIRELAAPPVKPRREIGFHATGKEAADRDTTKAKRIGPRKQEHPRSTPYKGGSPPQGLDSCSQNADTSFGGSAQGRLVRVAATALPSGRWTKLGSMPCGRRV